MSAPASFDPVPLDLQNLPPPVPPRYLKHQIYAEPRVFKHIDDHAINEARTNYRNFKDLIWNLVYKKNYNDLEKVRAIFRWMTTKNMFTIMFDSELPESPEAVLGAFKDDKTTYARIFECLARYAGLYCVTLSGWAKGVDYRPGAPITSGPINHSWNAVNIDGNWQLVDCHWATRYLQSERNTPENLVYEYDDFYFLPPPVHLVFSHYPEDIPFQLVYPVNSKQEYEDFPLVKSFFFNIGMQFQDQNQGVLLTKKGILALSLISTRPTAFTFKLVYGDGGVDVLQGVQLKRYIIQETLENRVSFYLRAPKEGNYYLTIFAQLVGERIRVENVFKAICEYKIVCDQAAGDIRPYPLCSDSNWGPGAPVRQYGLIPSQMNAILVAPNGRAELQFEKTRDVRLYARLTKDGLTDEQLEQCVAVREQENQVYITVHVPAKGEYGLEIYANEPDKEGDTFTHMCQYLTAYIDRDPSTVYGQCFDYVEDTHGFSVNPESYEGYESQMMMQNGNLTRSAPPDRQDFDCLYKGYSGDDEGSGVFPKYQDWEEGAQAQRRFREELTPFSGGYKHHTPSTMQRLANDPTGSLGRKYPSSNTGPRPYKPPGANVTNRFNVNIGSNDDFPPPPPPELLDQQNTHQLYGAPGEQGQMYGGGHYRPGQDSGNIRYGPGGQDAGNNRYGTGGRDAGNNRYGPGGYASPSSGSDLDVPSAYQRGLNQSSDELRKPVEVVYVPGTRAAKDGEFTGSLGRNGQLPGGLYSSGSLGRDGKAGLVASVSPGGKKAWEVNGRVSPYTGPGGKDTGDEKSKSSDQGSLTGSRSGSAASSPASSRKAGKTYESRIDVIKSSRTPSGTNTGGLPGTQQYTDQYGREGLQGDKPGTQYSDQFDRERFQETSSVPGENYHFGTLGPAGRDTYLSFAHRPMVPEKEYTPHDEKKYTASININAPSTFLPQPVEDKEEPPEPVPPTVAPKPFKDTSIFQNVDVHAVEVSKEEHKSFRDLVWHLIFARKITNELEKARAIFLWLCSKDLTKLNFDNIAKGSPEEILMNLQKGQTTYAVVYETLCSYAGLHCKTISGYAKGAEYKPGMKFTGELGQHSWNCVLVDGTWRLVDCHWAARRLVGKKGDKEHPYQGDKEHPYQISVENVRYELDEYYFMPDPHQLIFTHFPDDSNWQLLSKTISLSDFENLVPVKSAFFKYGLQILSHREAVINTNREVTIRVGCPPFKSETLSFTFTLTMDDGSEEYKGIKLNRYGMQEMLDNVSYFTVRVPEKGSYRLILYAKDLTQASKDGVYGGVCEYELVANAAIPDTKPFPPCVHTSWGPGDSVTKYDIKPKQKGAIFCTVNGQAEVKFDISKELRFTAKLKSNDKDDKSLQGYIMHRVVGNVAVFTITAPFPDEFGLEIYANDPDTDGNSLYHAYQYLIICTEVKGTVEPLPSLPPGYLGPQPSFTKYGMTAMSHSDPYILTEDGNVSISFGMATSLRMTSQLIYSSNNASEDCSDYILQQSLEKSIAFQLKLPKVGMYKFQLYALPFEDSSENLPGVYNYLINCKMTLATLSAFPKQYGQWKEGCYLYEPHDGDLSPHRQAKGNATSLRNLYFKVAVPKAKSVAVVIGDDWTQLQNKTGNTWEAEVEMDKHWGKNSKAAVCANFGATKASYSTLLEYGVN